MKILYDYQIFNVQKYGGISRYLAEIITRIAQFDQCEVKVLAGFYINHYLDRCSPELVIGWKRPLIPNTTKITNILNDGLSKLWLSTNNRPDIIHETYYSPRKNVAKSCKTVITVYDMIHERLSNFFPQSVRRFSRVKAEAIKRADRVICISNQTKIDLIEILDINPQKITVIYLGSSFQMSDVPNSDLSKTEYPYILYVGTRKGYKNFDRLLQAYAIRHTLNHNFKLVCVGAEPFSPSELEQIYSLGLNDNKVKHISGNERTLAEFYNQASVFVYPSLYEGFGIPLLEAMSLNCPIVCSNTGSIPEIAGNAAEFFDPYEADSIADALEKVLFSWEKAKNLVSLGRERVKQFSWENCAEKTHLLYSSLL